MNELTEAGANPNAISPLEKELFRKWAFQEVTLGLGCKSLMQAEAALGEEFEAVDITLSSKAERLMSATFKIRADKVAAEAAAAGESSAHSTTT